jgi:hypothetical protein
MPVAFGYRQVNNTRGVMRCQPLMLDPANAVDAVALSLRRTRE